LLDSANDTAPVFPAFPTPSVTSEPTSEPTPNNEFSTGGKVGTTVGAIAAVTLLGVGVFLFRQHKQKKQVAELDRYGSTHELAGISSQQVWELPHKPDITAELQSPHGAGEVHSDERSIKEPIPSSPQELYGDEPVQLGPPRSPVGLDYVSPVEIENMHSGWSAKVEQ
jgi:uncharacterized protein HemX